MVDMTTQPLPAPTTLLPVADDENLLAADDSAGCS